jgi:uncharacterized protein YyaL (SSP411 family)
MLAELRADGGAFYSSLDADAAGVEGSYYVWEKAAVRAALSAEEYAVFAAHHGLDLPPNFEHHAHHLIVAQPLEALAAAGLASPAQLAAVLESARARLLALRAGRVRPARDEEDPRQLECPGDPGPRGRARAGSARAGPGGTEALRYLHRHHWRGGRLLATSGGGEDRSMPTSMTTCSWPTRSSRLATVRFDAGELRFAGELLEVVLGAFADRGATEVLLHICGSRGAHQPPEVIR